MHILRRYFLFGLRDSLLCEAHQTNTEILVEARRDGTLREVAKEAPER
jgi:hypothetical protein